MSVKEGWKYLRVILEKCILKTRQNPWKYPQDSSFVNKIKTNFKLGRFFLNVNPFTVTLQEFC